MGRETALPDGLDLVRTTPRFTEDTAPAGLLNEHRVAEGVWGRLVVHRGSLRFVFDSVGPGGEGVGSSLGAGDSQVIPPTLPHHVELIGPVEFEVEFWRPVTPGG